MPELKFNQNYNRKLDCDTYTTFRLDSKTLRKGEVYEVHLKGTHHHRAVCLDKKTLKLADVNEWVAQLDASMTAKDFKKLVHDIYSRYVTDPDNAQYCLLLMKKIR